MSAVLAAPPAGRALKGRVPDGGSTPGRLRRDRILVIALALLTGLFGTVAVALASSGTGRVVDETEPLLVNAAAIYTSIADADATAAQAFLAGGVQPDDLVARYNADIKTAGEQLALASSRAGQEGKAADAVRRLAVMLPKYTGYIEAAKANNRQNIPVGVSYLLTASELAQGVAATDDDPGKDGLLIAAQDLFDAEQSRLSDDYGSAKATVWIVITLLFLVALLLVLLRAQLFITRRTHRVVNVGLASATALTVVLAIIALSVFGVQRHRLDEARANGSDPVVKAAIERISVLTQRGAESLTLAAYEGRTGPSEARYQTEKQRLLGADRSSGLLLDDSELVDLAKAYDAQHVKVRALDDKNQYNDAVRLARGDAATAFNALDTKLSQRVDDAQQRFTDESGKAKGGLPFLLFLVPLVALAVIALSAIGIRARLEEYR